MRRARAKVKPVNQARAAILEMIEALASEDGREIERGERMLARLTVILEEHVRHHEAHMAITRALNSEERKPIKRKAVRRV